MGLCDYGCYFEFSVLRCQPLNRALAEVKKNHKIPCSFFLGLRL
ncbi:acetyltransferase [Vibrio sp. 3-2(1)]|nr:acetyltransferase [Vibrio sp. 3-2(1)]